MRAWGVCLAEKTVQRHASRRLFFNLGGECSLRSIVAIQDAAARAWIRFVTPILAFLLFLDPEARFTVTLTEIACNQGLDLEARMCSKRAKSRRRRPP